MRLFIIHKVIDDILDNLDEPLRQLSEFPEIRSALINSLITGEILSSDNSLKMEQKSRDEERNKKRKEWTTASKRGTKTKAA